MGCFAAVPRLGVRVAGLLPVPRQSVPASGGPGTGRDTHPRHRLAWPACTSRGISVLGLLPAVLAGLGGAEHSGANIYEKCGVL